METRLSSKHVKKMQALKDYLQGLHSIVVAFSGGIDSRFLAYTLLQSHIPFSAVHLTGEHVPQTETNAATQWLVSYSVPFVTLPVSVLSVPEIIRNDTRRCYYCKKHLFLTITKHFGNRASVLEGSNESDKQSYRPGELAVKELGILSPLALCGLSKSEIRHIARQTGMDNPDQPSHPCLLTRFGYNFSPSQQLLRQLELCEDALCKLGVTSFRLRLPDAHTATLFIDKNSQTVSRSQASILSILTEYGFAHATIEYTDTLSGWYDKEQKLSPS